MCTTRQLAVAAPRLPGDELPEKIAAKTILECLETRLPAPRNAGGAAQGLLLIERLAKLLSSAPPLTPLQPLGMLFR